MSIPTVLIATTISEFRAEGYSSEGLAVNSSYNGDKEVQYVTLTFKKEEEANG